jgi:hypothetical protein
MATIFDPAIRHALVDRVARLRPETSGRWGRLTCPQMLAHVNDAMRMGLGDLPTRPMNQPLRFPGIKHVIIFIAPWPKSVETAPELLTRVDAASWDREREDFPALLARFGARAGAATWPVHPLFGRLSRRAWGVLMYRHADHHLTQFGV